MSPYTEAAAIPVVATAQRLGLEFHRMGDAVLIRCPMPDHQGPPVSCFLSSFTAYCWRCRWVLNSYQLVSVARGCSEHDAIRWLLNRPELWRGPLFQPRSQG